MPKLEPGVTAPSGIPLRVMVKRPGFTVGGVTVNTMEDVNVAPGEKTTGDMTMVGLVPGAKNPLG